MTIPQGHPRLWWNAERIARARTWHQSNPFNPRTSPPEDQALDNAFLYILTGNASHCRTAITAAASIVVNDRAANHPTEGVASNGMRWYGEHVILTYDWCYDQMTAFEKDLLLTRWNFYLDNIRQHPWGGAAMVESNYMWGYLRNMLEWGITTYGESSLADVFLNDALVTRWANSFVPYANSPTGGRGGVWQEGSNYGPTIGDYSTVPFVSATLLGRDIFGETNYQRENVYYVIYATTPGQTHHNRENTSNYEVFPFSDDERFSEGGFPTKSATWGNFMTTMSDHWRGEATGQYARKWINTVSASRSRHIRAVDRGSAELEFSSLPLDYYAPAPAFLYGRNRWGAQSTAWQIQLGLANDEGHGHNDLGSWQIWRNGRWLVRETTGYSNPIAGYTSGSSVDTNQAVAHNGILIGGLGAAVAYGQPRDSFVVRRLESRPDYAYAAVDLGSAYASRSARVVREFVFVRPLDTMVIFDRVDSPADKTFLAHFEQSPTIDQANRIVTAPNGDQALRLTTLVPATPSYRVVTEGGSVGQYRLELTSTTGGQGYFLNVLQAKGGADPNLTASVVENATSYVATLSHPVQGTVTLTFQKGAASAGGTVVINGTTSTLLDRVQGISVTPTGPVWEGAGPAAPSAPTNLRFVP